MQFQLPPLKLTVPGSNVKKYQLVYPIEGKKERKKKIIVQSPMNLKQHYMVHQINAWTSSLMTWMMALIVLSQNFGSLLWNWMRGLILYWH